MDRSPGPCGYGNGGIQDILGSRKNQLEVMREQDAPILPISCWHLVMVNAPKKVCAQHSRGCAVHRSVDLWQRLCAIYGLMEDAATAEISRTSIWHGSIIKKR